MHERLIVIVSKGNMESSSAHKDSSLTMHWGQGQPYGASLRTDKKRTLFLSSPCWISAPFLYTFHQTTWLPYRNHIHPIPH